MSSETTDSSSADISSPDTSPAQTVPRARENQVASNTNTISIIDNDDSASDVSMSADSEDEDDENPNTSAIHVNPVIHVLEQPTYLDQTNPASDSSKKRKYPDSTGETLVHNGGPHEFRKRLKADEDFQNHWTPDGRLRRDKSLLPAEIWHHIFTFCPPRILGVLLRVNKSFNAYLDPSPLDYPITPLSRSALQLMKPDAIWQASRRLFRPGMPAPLTRKSELDMWKLACCFSCQFCGKRRSQLNPMLPLDLWRPGPGENGVVPIWSFGIRTCGPCLQQRSSKVMPCGSLFSGRH
jgi:hypothetical protein